MWKIIVVCLLILAVCWAMKTIAKKPAPKKRSSSLKTPKKELSIEQILGKSHFKVSHSTPQVRSYEQTEQGIKNESIFADDKKKEPSEHPLDEGQNEEFSEQPNIDKVPLEFEPKREEKYSLNLGEEDELEDSTPDGGNVEYGNGVTLMSIIEAFSTVGREDALPEERQRAAEVFDKMRGTEAMEQLRSEPKRAVKIDELINERFAQLPKVIRSEDDSDEQPTAGGTDGFNIYDYLPN